MGQTQPAEKVGSLGGRTGTKPRPDSRSYQGRSDPQRPSWQRPLRRTPAGADALAEPITQQIDKILARRRIGGGSIWLPSCGLLCTLLILANDAQFTIRLEFCNLYLGDTLHAALA